MKPVDSNRILITGVSRGLGRAMTAEFIRLGHSVIGCARKAEAIAELQRKYGPAHRFDVVDVTSDKAVAAWAESFLKTHGAPHLLLNNAALANSPRPLWEVPADEFDRVVAVNVLGVANVIRHVVPAMIGAGRGIVVNFSSGWGHSTDAGVAPYCATKWAIEGLTQALAKDLPKGMAAIPLSPGVIDTDMLRRTFGDAAASYETPEVWVKRAVPFLLKLGPRDNGKSLSIS